MTFSFRFPLVVMIAVVIGSAVAHGAPSPATTIERFFATEATTPPPFPRRVLWLTIPSGDEGVDRRLRQLEEAANDRVALDVAPADVGRYFLKRMNDRRLPVAGLPLGEAQRKAVVDLAHRTNATLIALVWAEGGAPKLALLDTNFATLASYDDPWRSTMVAGKEGGEESVTGATSIATEAGGEFSRTWNGQFAGLLSDRSEKMTLRDRVPIRRFDIDGAVQSAVVMANGAYDGVTVAYATKSGVKVVGVEGDKLLTFAETTAGDVTPISLVPYDLDDDGTDELLINAYGDEGLASFILRFGDRRLSSISRGLPQFFSLTADGALLAQEAMDGFPAPTMKISRVTAQEGSLQFVSAVTLTGNEIPVGVNRFDLDGDGAFELAGAGSKGDLMLFTFGGAVTWRGGDFGASPRVVEARKRNSPDRSYAVPPVPQLVIDPTLGPLVAVAGSSYAERGLFSTPTLVKGTVWFVRPTAEGYVVEDAYREGEATVVDLIPMNRGAHARTDAIGFVLKVRGVMKDSSVLVLPVQ